LGASVRKCAPTIVTARGLESDGDALDSERMIGELVDALGAALQVATTDPGPDASRQRRRTVTLVLVAGLVVIAAVMVAIALTVHVLTN
jgi:hypothetical protein